MGGALTNLAAVKHGLTTYDPTRVQGTSSTSRSWTGRSGAIARAAVVGDLVAQHDRAPALV
jgi:hypothetical protein